MAVATTTSTDGTITGKTGTLQEVINALESDGMNDFSKILMYWDSNANKLVAVYLTR